MRKRIAIVDEQGNPKGSSTVEEARKLGLWHQVAAIYVFDKKHRIFVQKRADTMDTYPGCWDHSAAGHVDEGETPEEAAKRELEEELGCKVDKLELVTTFKSATKVKEMFMNRHWYLYKCENDGPFVFQEDEVSEGKFVEISEIVSDQVKHPENYADGFLFSMKEYLKK